MGDLERIRDQEAIRRLTVWYTVREKHGFDSTQHLNGNHEITVVDDRASSTHYVLAEHCIRPEGGGAPGADDFVTAGGYYRSQYRKTKDGWKIASLVFTPLFLRGNPDLFTRARGE